MDAELICCDGVVKRIDFPEKSNRLTQRKDCVKFIVKGLGSNILQHFEEGNFRKEQSLSRTRTAAAGFGARV